MPKKKKLIYDPDAQLGYEFLANRDQFNRAGIALQSGIKSIAHNIDSEVQRRRRQNAKENEWEEKKKQESEQNKRLSEYINDKEDFILPNASDPFGGINLPTGEMTAFAKSMGEAYGHIKNKDVPGTPDDYQLSDFFKDQWNAYFGEMNHLQAEDARGYQVRAANDKALIQAYIDSLDKLDEIDSINNRLREINGTNRRNFNANQLTELNNEIDSLVQRRDQLKREYNALAPQRKQLEDTTKQSSFGATWDRIVSGNDYYGNGGITGVFGSTTALHDEINDARRFLWDLGDSNKSRIETRRQLDRALNEYDKLNEGWNNIIKENEAEAKYHKDKISAWYKGREEKAGTDFFDPDTYLFKMPGIMGGSSSSYMKQIPGMIVGLGGGITAGLATGGTAWAAALLGGAGSFAFNRGAGISENNAEVALAAKEVIKDKTGLTEKQIDDVLSGKDTDIRKLRKIRENIKSSENLFNRDMAATTWDAAIDAALNVVPVGSMARLRKWVKGTKAFEKAMANAAVKEAVESNIGRDFIAGYRALDATSPIAGVLGGAANATLGRATRNGLNLLARKTEESAVGQLGKRIGTELSMLSKAAQNINPAEVIAKHGLINGTRAQYMKDIGGRLIKSGISEGIEEGKQHVNAEAFKNGELSPEIQNIFEIGMADMLNGLTMGAYVLGIPLDGLGIINIKDKDLLAEIKGGMLGGWGHTAMMNTIREVAPYIRQQAANDIVLEQIFRDKFANLSDFQQYSNWISKGLFKPGYNEVLRSFDRLREINKTNSQAGSVEMIPSSLIDQAEQDYKRVISIAQDPLTRQEAKDAGINVRTLTDPTSWKSNKEYHEYVALKAIARKALDEKRANSVEASQNLAQALNSARESIRQRFLSEQSAEYTALTKKYLESGASELESLPETTALLNDQANDRNTDFEYTSGIAQLAALFEYRHQIEVGLEAQKNNPNAKVRRGLKQQLERIDEQIKQLSKSSENLLHGVNINLGNGQGYYRFGQDTINTLHDLETRLVYNQEEHDELKAAYLDYFKWRDEYNTAEQSYENLTGKIQRIGEDGNVRDLNQEDSPWDPRKHLDEVSFTGSNAKDIIKQLHEMEEDDDDFESMIEKVYQEDLKAQHLADANAISNPEFNPQSVRPVNDGHGEQIRVEFDENGRPTRQIAKNEFFDDQGLLWEYTDNGRSRAERNPFEVRRTEEEIEEQIRQSFREAFTNITGQTLPFSTVSVIEQRKRASLNTAALAGSNPPESASEDGKTKNKYITPSIEVREKDLDPQEQVIAALREKYERDKSLVMKDEDGYHTTGQDYFIIDEEKVVRMSRVHAVKPEPYVKPEDNKPVNDLFNKLKEAKSLEEIQEIVLQDGTGDNLTNRVNPYFKYIDDNSTIFFNNPTPENYKEYIDTLRHLAREAIESYNSASIKMGNVMDELGRNFFGSDQLYTQTATQDGILQLWNSVNEADGRTYSQLFQSYDEFKRTIDQLRKAYWYYTEKLQWKLLTLPLTWRAKFNTGWMAGETDLIAVDKDGDIHIIDFKTSMRPFGIQTAYNHALTTSYANVALNILTEEDFKDGKLSKKARNVLKSIKEDSNTDYITLKWESGTNGLSGRAVVYNKTSNFLQVQNAGWGQVLTPFVDYKNQQTSYARMISVETGNSVRSIEILPMHCVYAYSGPELKYINRVTVQDRMVLPFSSEMDQILTGIQERNTSLVNQLKTEITAAYEDLLHKRYNVIDRMESVFDELSDEGKQIYSDYLASIDNIQIPEEDDVDLLKSVLNDINAIINQYNSIKDQLNADYTRQKDKEAELAENKQKQEAKAQQIQIGEVASTERAKNKRDSYGNTSHTNLNYRQVEADRDLELATSSPDFIENADFELYIEGDDIFVDISHNGKTWKHVLIDTKYNGSRFSNGQRLFDQIQKLQEQKQPGQRIVPVRSTMNRTPGAIKLGKDSRGNYVYQFISNTDLFIGEDLFDIEFSKTYKRIGFVDDARKVVTFDGSDTAPFTLYTWTNPNYASAPGTLIYLKHVRKNELNADSIIPVAIDRVKLQEKDIDFILQLLQNPDLLDRSYSVEINGETYNINATGRQLANILIPIVDNESDLNNITSIVRNPNNPQIIQLKNRTDLASNSIGRGQFDISTQEGLQRLRQELATLSVAERHEVLLARLGDDNHPLLPFAGIRKFFNEHGKNPDLQHVSITDTLQFDLDDFRFTKSAKGIQRKGLNGFAYYLKHNMLITQYAGMGSCNVEIKDVILEDSTVPEVQSNGVNTIPDAPKSTDAIDSSIIDDAFLMKQSSKKPRRKMTKKRAERHIKAILGDSVPVEFYDTFITVSSGAAHVVGNCKTDAIQISSFAGTATDYHEAFHRIFEMLIPEGERDQVYGRIAKTMGIQLKDSKGNEILENYHRVAEWAADMYMDFMKYHLEVKIPILTKLWNKIHDWSFMMDNFDDTDLYKIFVRINRGEYKEARPSEKAIERFERLYRELHCTISGVDFDHIVNLPMYDKLKETVTMCIIMGQNVDKSGRNITEVGRHIDQETFMAGATKLIKMGYDVLGQTTETPSVSQQAMQEIYDKFNYGSIRDDIADQISFISTDYIKQIEDDSTEDADGGEATNANIGEHTKSSYEFSRFSKTSSRVRFFFATIPDTTYKNVTTVDDNGKPVIKKVEELALNELGMPTFVPVNTVFNEVLNLFHDVDTVYELISKMQRIAKEDAMYNRLHKALKHIYETTYIVKDGKLTRNSDQEALLSQLMNVIRSNRHKFEIAKATTQKGANTGLGVYNITIQSTDTDYNAHFYPNMWNQMLVNGATPILKVDRYGRVVFNPKQKGSETSFLRLASMFDHYPTVLKAENGSAYTDVGIKQWLENAVSENPKPVYLKLKVNGQYAYYNDPTDPSQLEVVKDKIIESLNSIGISFSKAEFKYMLRHKYGSDDYVALSKMFSSRDITDSMTSFLKFLRDVSTNGVINTELRIGNKKVKLENAYSKLAFIKDLANWKYQYRHAHDQLTVLATGNNKFYEISDNNYASDVIRMLNKRDDEFEEIKSDIYNYVEDTENPLPTGEIPTYGSLILKELTDNSDRFITLRNFVGFKTDKRGDQGSDYFEISRREDYVAKAAILQKGGIIMPTLSDKKTYFYLDGVELPGLDYTGTIDENGNVVPFSNLGDQFVISKDPISQLENMLSQNPLVIDQFISYAYSEYYSIKKADRDLDQMEADGTKSSEVSNFYTKEQGAKFSSLLGVWEYDYKTADDGSRIIVGETFHSFNENKPGKTRKTNIQEAENRFFKQPRDVQEALIARLLHKALLKEIDACVKLGLIEKVDDSDNIFYNYQNVGLDSKAINVIYKSLIAKNGQPADAKADARYKSLAVMIYLNDISVKAIMSGQETERVFSGNPSFYKWKYNDEGKLVDRTVDELKRLGGVVSTGNNNFIELQDIPQKYLDESGRFTGEYVCAQVGNELIESPQIKDIEEQNIYGESLTSLYIQEEEKALAKFREDYQQVAAAMRDDPAMVSEETRKWWDENKDLVAAEQRIRLEVSAELDKLSLEEIRERLDPRVKSIVDRKAKEATDSYRLKFKKDGSIDKGIDVADGGAYITDDMAEMLLRMNGNYSAEIENAFKILREEKTSTILQKQQAYQAIQTSVIGTQKYTAFGRRKHQKTGIQIPYYNKMALFPLFRCMATGKMANIFDKMKQQGIDMLMVDSAVKLGGQGSKDINWDSYSQKEGDGKQVFSDSFDFDTYSQKFLYLRKQLNTDPKEEVYMNVGTQMTKVAMANLLDGRIYTMQDGTVINGMELRDDIMNAINELSNRGLNSIHKRFFKTNKDGQLIDKDGNIIDESNKNPKVLDPVKFAREVRQLLTAKDPDSNIVSALQIVEQKDNDGNVTKHLRLPLNAISNSGWLESNVISAINKKVIDIETPGAAFIQRSVWGMEGSAMFSRKNGSIIGDEDLSPEINGGQRLKMINEEGSMDCVLSADFFKKMLGGDIPLVPIKDKNRNVIWDLIPETDSRGNIKKDEAGKTIYSVKKDKDGKPMTDKNGNPIYRRKMRMREMTFDELRNWLIKRGIIGPNAKANIIGYRIPTQAQSSIHALRCVDIVPAVNDTVILPAEFTKITGSDFDIDKLFLSSLRYKVNREQGEDGKYHQTITSEFKETEDAYYQNKIIKDYITLLLDWKSNDEKISRTTNILHRSIDNDTELLKKIIEDIEAGMPDVEETPYSFYTLSTQTASKDDYITGKIGIGPFALNNNNHILTMLYHVKFKHIESSIMNELGLERLDGRVDKNGESIMSWISALINAHVDIAKDPYISRLNVNPFTYNLVNLLVRTGLGDKTFYFTSQPIMRELATAYVNAASMYMADPYSSVYKLQEQAIEDVEKAWFTAEGAKGKDIKIAGYPVEAAIKAIKEGGTQNSSIRSAINKEIKKLFGIDDVTGESKFDAEIKNDAKNPEPNYEHQLLYYLAYLQFDKYAKALSGLVTYSKIDTKKQGKSVTEQLVYRDGYNKTYDLYRDSNLFDPIGLKEMRDKSYIATKTKNGINSVIDILSSQFIQSSTAFLGSVDKILKSIGRAESLSANLVKSVSDALSAAVKSKFFVDEYVPSISNNPNFIHDLVSESQEVVEFNIPKQGNAIQVSGQMMHALQSYNFGKIQLSYLTQSGGYYTIPPIQIIGIDESTNTVYTDKNIPAIRGRALLLGGKNTIYDRFSRLQVEIRSNPDYAKLLSPSGDIANHLLNMMVPGKEVEYTPSTVVGEMPDTYSTLKFVKLFNFIEDGSNTANYIIDAWEELLSYTDDNKEVQNTIREFARDLIVYAFVTSGDKGGFTKMFKYVPTSWRESSGYGNFIQSKLVEYQIGQETDIDIDDVILNNWYDNQIVPTYKLQDPKTKASQFMKYYTKINGKELGYPTILAALKSENGKLVPSINPDSAPKFIKIARRKDHDSYDSQRRFTVYKMHNIARSKDGVAYPVYIKVNPKGIQVSGGFIMTEYGRSDAINQEEYTINEEVLEGVYKASNVSEHINLVKNTAPEYAAIIAGLSREYMASNTETVEQQVESTEDNGEQQVDEIDYNNPLNIYAGTHENENLSNMAVRPFTFQGWQFRSVEHAFHVAKLQGLATWLHRYSQPSQALDNVIEKINQNIQRIQSTDNPYEARKIGKEKITTRSSTLRDSIQEYFNNKSINSAWTSTSRKAMRMFMEASFEQNPDALNELLSTGNRLLTHLQGGEWAEDMPRILMDVRKKLRNSQQQNDTFDDSEFSDDAMNHCKS